MQKCKKCNSKIGYKNKLRTLLFDSSPIICEGCGSKYYVRFSTRVIRACLFGLPVFLVNHSFDTLALANKSNAFGYYLIWIVLVILVMPFWAGYYEKDDGNIGVGCGE